MGGARGCHVAHRVAVERLLAHHGHVHSSLSARRCRRRARWWDDDEGQRIALKNTCVVNRVGVFVRGGCVIYRRYSLLKVYFFI